jgi:transcription elongation factor GreA
VSQFITKAGLQELENEYKEINDVKIPEILVGLNQALALGDLSENAARDSLLFEQQRMLARKQEIEEILNDYQIIDEKSPTKSRVVLIGNTVKIEYPELNKILDVKIMGSSEADALGETPKISNESPLATAILGKAIGSEATFRVKQKKLKVKIVDILE